MTERQIWKAAIIMWLYCIFRPTSGDNYSRDVPCSETRHDGPMFLCKTVPGSPTSHYGTEPLKAGFDSNTRQHGLRCHKTLHQLIIYNNHNKFMKNTYLVVNISHAQHSYLWTQNTSQRQCHAYGYVSTIAASQLREHTFLVIIHILNYVAG